MKFETARKRPLTALLPALFMASMVMPASVYADNTASSKANAAAADALKHAHEVENETEKPHDDDVAKARQTIAAKQEQEDKETESEKKSGSTKEIDSEQATASSDPVVVTASAVKVRFMEGCHDIISSSGDRNSRYYLTHLINAIKTRAKNKETLDDGIDDRSDKEKEDDDKLSKEHDRETDNDVKTIEIEDVHDNDRKVSSHEQDLFHGKATGKIRICHNGHTITVAMAAAGGHSHHADDTIGACTQAQKDEHEAEEEHEKDLYESSHSAECRDEHDDYVSADDDDHNHKKFGEAKKDCNDGDEDNSSYINSKFGNSIIKVTTGTGDAAYSKAIDECLKYGGGVFVPGNPGGVSSAVATSSAATSSNASSNASASGSESSSGSANSNADASSNGNTEANGNASAAASATPSTKTVHGGRMSLREVKK